MRYFAAGDSKPADYCRTRVSECEIYVAVIGFRYGSFVPGESVSYTELEFAAAGVAGIPRLVFLREDNTGLPASMIDADLSAVEGFRQRLRDAGLIVRTFHSESGLELEVFHALVSLAGGPAAATKTLPRDIASLIGRKAQLQRLLRSVEKGQQPGGMVGIYAIDGMAGIGKTAFAVRAAHKIAARFPDGQIFLRLHGHTPGQRRVYPADALASLLQTAGIPAARIPDGLEARAGLWRDHLSGKQVLLVLDDAFDYDQIRDLLPGSTDCLVLVTSRQRLLALEDSQAISLDTLTPKDSGVLFAQLAKRPGLKSTNPAVREIAHLCGYLPLAISMLARQLHHHPAWTPAFLASELKSARRLQMMGTANLSVAAAFDLSYQELDPRLQRTFMRLGLHPGTEIEAFAVAAMDESDEASARNALEALYQRHLIGEPAGGRFRFHDLIREYAQSRADVGLADEREAVTGRLLDYYVHMARLADGKLPSRTPAVTTALAVKIPPHYRNLADRRAAAEWMEAERFNLQAAAGYAITSARKGHVVAMAAAMHGYLTTQGHYLQACAVHELAMNAASNGRDVLAEAGALTDLGDAQHLLGNFSGAIASLTRAHDLYADRQDAQGEAGALTLLGDVLQGIGSYREAKASLNRALELYCRTSDDLGRSRVLGLLGCLQQATGDYQAATANLKRALELHRRLHNRLREAVTLSYLGKVQYLTGDYYVAADTLADALALHREHGHRLGQANVLTEIGALSCRTQNYAAASDALTEALGMHQRLGHLLGEAITRDCLGRVQYLTGDHAAAAESLGRALELHLRLSNDIGRAEVMNTMGELAAASSQPGRAVEWHKQASDIAARIGSPLQEARALEGIGMSLSQQGELNDAREKLGMALTIYRQIGCPNAVNLATRLAENEAPQHKI
jgi:tetratricopeptide (TPR) repeat protein